MVLLEYICARRPSYVLATNWFALERGRAASTLADVRICEHMAPRG